MSSAWLFHISHVADSFGFLKPHTFDLYNATGSRLSLLEAVTISALSFRQSCSLTLPLWASPARLLTSYSLRSPSWMASQCQCNPTQMAHRLASPGVRATHSCKFSVFQLNPWFYSWPFSSVLSLLVILPHSPDHPNSKPVHHARFLNLRPTDTLGWRIICEETVQVVVGCLAAFLTSTHQILTLTHLDDNPEWL